MGRSTFVATSNKNNSGTSNCSNCGGGESIVVGGQQSEDPRIVVLHGDVNEHTISSVIAQLLFLASQNRKPISLVVSTYGGSVDEMFSLYDTIKVLPCQVHTIALGKVMSAGVLLLAAGTKGKRLVGRNARIMMHPVSGGMEGNIFEIEHETAEHRRIHDLMVSALLDETKMSKEEVEKIMRAGYDYYITAEQAIQLGIVDKMIGKSVK